MSLFIFFILASLASYGGVLISRGFKDSINGRSYCDNCKKELSALALTPVVGFIALHGKCEYCGEKVNPKYPITEFIAGLTGVLIYLILTGGRNG